MRDQAAMRGYLSKINELKNEVQSIESQLELRPTVEEVEMKFTQLQGYVTVKAFQGLSRVVSTKAEEITQDEIRVQVGEL